MEARVITGHRNRGRQIGLFVLAAIVLLLLVGAGWASSRLIEYSWWKEMGQVNTWLDLYAWSAMPVAIATVIAWIVLLIAH